MGEKIKFDKKGIGKEKGRKKGWRSVSISEKGKSGLRGRFGRKK